MSIKRLVIAAIASVTLALSLGAAANATGNHNHDDRKVGICHATGSSTNPYVFIRVDKHAENAHKNHQDGRDIIGIDSKDDCPKDENGHVSSTSTSTPDEDEQGKVESETVTELPKTGAVAAISSLTGLAALGYTATAYIRSRK